MWPTKFPDKIWEWSVNGQRIWRFWVILVIQVNNILIHSIESYGGPTLAGAKLRTSYTQGAEFILNGWIFNWWAFLQWFTTSAKEDLPETLRWAELLISCPTLIRGLFTESEHTAHGENSASRGGHCPTAWCIASNLMRTPAMFLSTDWILCIESNGWALSMTWYLLSVLGIKWSTIFFPFYIFLSHKTRQSELQNWIM